jgi:hypothetical protein
MYLKDECGDREPQFSKTLKMNCSGRNREVLLFGWYEIRLISLRIRANQRGLQFCLQQLDLLGSSVCPLQSPLQSFLSRKYSLSMFGQRDAKLLQDSPPHSNEEDTYNPFAHKHGPPSPPRPTQGKKESSKILMMSTTDRESLSTRGVSFREPIARKKPSMEKTLKTYCSLCMAVFLFAGGLVS